MVRWKVRPTPGVKASRSVIDWVPRRRLRRSPKYMKPKSQIFGGNNAVESIGAAAHGSRREPELRPATRLSPGCEGLAVEARPHHCQLCAGRLRRQYDPSLCGAAFESARPA